MYIIIMLIFGLVGIKRGFVKSVGSLISTVISFVTAAAVSKPLSAMLIKKFNIIERVQSSINLSDFSIDGFLDALNKVPLQYISDGIAIPGDISAIVGSIGTVICMIFVFMICMIICGIIISTVNNGVNSISISKHMNRIFGGIFGCVKGFVIYWVIMSMVSFLSEGILGMPYERLLEFLPDIARYFVI
ncbi:MAG: CvpA family protein [Clostridiales bacterium]|nr:CvpA family protein [Clostridiales bacterium]